MTLDPMIALYALVEAVAEGKIAESEVVYTNTAPDGGEQRIELIVRHKIRPLTTLTGE